MPLRFRAVSTLALVGAAAGAGAGDVVATASRTPRPAACVAIVLPAVQGVEGNASDVSAALRELLSGILSGPSLRVVPLDARLQSQALEEAVGKSCPRVLTAAVTRKRGGGGGLLGRVLTGAATTAAWQVPGSGMVPGAARGAVVAGAETLSAAATGTRAKDEWKFEYTLLSADGATVLGPQTVSAKAQSNGEDVLTPLTLRVAEAVGAAVAGK